MPIWINALGIGGIGMVYGYVLIYALKRFLPPVAEDSISVKELILLLSALGMSSILGTAFGSMDGVNYIGPYGLGFVSGAAANIGVTVLLWWKFGPYLDEDGESEQTTSG